MKHHAAIGVALLSCVACAPSAEPRPQWRVTVSTDAPLPAIADRLLIEILDADGKLACTGCRRQLAAVDPERFPLSFGIARPAGDRPLRIRGRLFRASSTGPDGLPSGTALIDALGRLPPADGVSEVSLELFMDCFGVTSDVDRDLACDPETGGLAPAPRLAPPGTGLPSPGSWPPARRAPCVGTVPGGMLCIEGGVFVLGGPREPEIGEPGTTPERLVQLTPYAIDADEVTVGEVRALIAAGKLAGAPTQRIPLATHLAHACRYLDAETADNDAMPVNCISLDLAVQVCAARGASLPSEAQWEYAASARGSARAYPWGDEDDVCARAVVGRGRGKVLSFGNEDTSCIADQVPLAVPGPVAGGDPADVNGLEVRNLAGNVAEWTLDAHARYDDECWHPDARLLVDPVCAANGSPIASVRGGNWAQPPIFARVRLRHPSLLAGNIGTGFRCVRGMQ